MPYLILLIAFGYFNSVKELSIADFRNCWNFLPSGDIITIAYFVELLIHFYWFNIFC